MYDDLGIQSSDAGIAALEEILARKVMRVDKVMAGGPTVKLGEELRKFEDLEKPLATSDCDGCGASALGQSLSAATENELKTALAALSQENLKKLHQAFT